MARILIVDDDPLSIQVLYAAVDDGDSEIRFATNGEDALSLLEGFVADLVLLDAQMPGMDGFSTCKAIKAAYPGLPVVFVTSASDFASEIRALEAGAVDFVAKPINPPVVRLRVGAHLRLKAQSDLLLALTLHDSLTGIANRRALDERMDTEWRRAARHATSLAFLMIDIDYFKAYNDCYGHPAGDVSLRLVAQAIQASASRAGDLTARYGGEEFAVLLPGSDQKEALAVAKRIAAAIHDLAIPHTCSLISDRVTVSIGVAHDIPNGNWSASEREDEAPQVQTGSYSFQSLLDAADQALYMAKNAGRNCIQMGV